MTEEGELLEFPCTLSVKAIGSDLNQVWTNMIDNALDAMGDGGKLTLRARVNDMWVEVEIVDQTTELAMLALQGKGSQAVLQQLVEQLDLASLGYYKFAFGNLIEVSGATAEHNIHRPVGDLLGN